MVPQTRWLLKGVYALLYTEWKKHLHGNPTVFLATSVNDQPHVRPLTLIINNNEIWFATCKNDHKLLEIKDNTKCEICLVVSDPLDPQGSIRLHGGARIVLDDEIRKELGPKIPFFPLVWESYTDPNYVLIHFETESGIYHDAQNNTFHNLILGSFSYCVETTTGYI